MSRRFAAQPHQHLLTPAVVTTLFPHLSLRGGHTFQLLLAAGAALIGSLALAGLFPVALIAAAVLVPLLVLLYFREVDLYETEPLRVLAFTVAWGVAVGIGVGLLREAVESAGSVLAPQTTTHAVVWNGIALPLIGLAAVLAGPLVLLRYRKFNDVLDGVTFGGAAAACFAGAELVTHSSDFLSAGVAPAGLVAPWTLRVLTLGVAVPVLAAAAAGAAAGSFWLRYRSPAGIRGRYGLLGQPALAVLLAAALLVGSALAQLYLDRWAALAVLAALAGLAVIWLRVLIQIGLVGERAEAEAAAVSLCPNCRRAVFRQAFCSYCGAATRALPKHGRPHGRRERSLLISRFAAALALLVGVAVIVMAAAEPAAYRPPCAPGKPCALPPRLTLSGLPGTSSPRPITWTGLRGVQVTYDGRSWRVVQSSPSFLDITRSNTLELEIAASDANAVSGQQRLENELGTLRGRYPDLGIDPAHPLASATIGPIGAVGGMYAGHDAVDGRPVEVLIEVATSAGLQIMVSAWTGEQAQTSTLAAATPFDQLVQADLVLETLRWPFERNTGRA